MTRHVSTVIVRLAQIFCDYILLVFVLGDTGCTCVRSLSYTFATTSTISPRFHSHSGSQHVYPFRLPEPGSQRHRALQTLR
jgi:hypothetical protein